jgi:hypothetical protein
MLILELGEIFKILSFHGDTVYVTYSLSIESPWSESLFELSQQGVDFTSTGSGGMLKGYGISSNSIFLNVI